VHVVGHQGVDPGVADDEGELGTGKAEVQRHEAGAEPGRGEHGLEEGGLIEAEEAHPVAVAHPAGPQTGRQPVDPVEELGVGPGRALEAQRPAVRAGRRPSGEPAPEADVDVVTHGFASSDCARRR
jgi:hypothetical protein